MTQAEEELYKALERFTGVSLYIGYTQIVATLPDGSYYHAKNLIEITKKLIEHRKC